MGRSDFLLVITIELFISGVFEVLGVLRVANAAQLDRVLQLVLNSVQLVILILVLTHFIMVRMSLLEGESGIAGILVLGGRRGAVLIDFLAARRSPVVEVVTITDGVHDLLRFTLDLLVSRLLPSRVVLGTDDAEHLVGMEHTFDLRPEGATTSREERIIWVEEISLP